MKKVVLFLALVGLVAGIAQAQTPKVRKVWERTLNTPIFTTSRCLAFDPERLGAVVKTTQGYQFFDSTGRVTLVDTMPDLQNYFPNVFSPNGCFLGLNRQIHSQIYSQLPLPFVIDGQSGRRLLRDVCSNCEIWAISNDGRSILMAKDLFYGPEITYQFMIGQHATLRFCAGDGRVIRELPMYGFQRAKFSGNGKRLVLFVWRRRGGSGPEPNLWDPGTIIEFDTQGNEIWRDAAHHSGWFSVSDSGDVLSIVERDRTAYARFYDRDGRMLKEIHIERPSTLMGTSISADGKNGIIALRTLNGDSSCLLFVDATRSTPRWEKTFGRLIDYDGQEVSAGISPEGGQVFIDFGDNNPLIFNAYGQALVGDRREQPTHFVLAKRGYFLEISGQKIALNQIMP